ncbi:MAG: RAMP superfamily CRISPR-associated protein [Bacteroidales bacterium]|nr:RAMP superfamily CRISPR-associated protein [Bacteroidales bacterium]
MADINYKITFYSDWHAGSGLTSGSDLDALVIKSKEGLPYIPGRTLKGLLKDAALSIKELKSDPVMDDFVDRTFGKENKPSSGDEGDDKNEKGGAYFTNAELNSFLKIKVLNENLSTYFFHEIASTAMKPEGITLPHSLRKMQVTIPLVLEASILNVDDDHKQAIIDTLRWIKRLGQNRNHGLGRCKFEFVKEGGNQ